jgi:hypothetical protein
LNAAAGIGAESSQQDPDPSTEPADLDETGTGG